LQIRRNSPVETFSGINLGSPARGDSVFDIDEVSIEQRA
jgi:hypothetical protein